ncbi:DUF6120 family protein [Acutalibacter muris]|uniref:DUF6120 family protein n=1 Tax=Acutalibacter muris TaxID=1796620 RepID=UPI001C3E95B5|nr:DUF6120 family protein [Acutalibacter muris]
MSHTVDGYLNKVKKEVKHSGDQDLKYYGFFVQEVEGYLAEKPKATMQEVEEYFGTPKNVLDDYLETQQGKALRNKFLRCKKLSYVLRAALVVLLAIIAILIAVRVTDGLIFSHGQYNRVVYEGTPPPDTESYVEIY